MKCSACGCENEEFITVCAQCGAELTASPAATYCCHCGKQIRPTAKYCVYCGGKQEKEAPAEVIEEQIVSAEAPVEDSAVVEEPVDEESVTEESVAKEVVTEETTEPEAAEDPVQEPTVFHEILPAPKAAPAYQLPTRRGLGKMIFLGILTGLLYPMVVLSRISVEINMVASRHDGKRTMHFLWMPVVGVLTLGVYFFVWAHKLCDRIGDELNRRQVGYQFGAGSFWLWNFLWGILGAAVTAVLALVLPTMPELRMASYFIVPAAGLLSSIGPFVFTHKLMRAMNLMNADYNENG